jgi:peptidoglycan/LPS O-acetylase OafA/YrhL
VFTPLPGSQPVPVAPHIPYRPDIDGLRAVAVLLVMLFHADLGVPGGFIGVDVFFVISGYLMTALLLKDRSAPGPAARLRDFYARRIRRIIPAATVMTVVVLVAGAAIMLPKPYAALAKSAIAQQLMASNIYFWRNTGYFDGAAETMPLLHTWSLAVEEQFYLGYPLLLLCMRRARRSRVRIALILLTVASLALSIYGARYHPWGTFYLLPMRAWELLLGGLICVVPPPRRIAPWLLNAAGIASLGAIVGASFLFTKHTRFPGAAALVPCLAAAVLIYSNRGAPRATGALLAWRPLVIVGLMSYSLYLWHWPVLAFARIRLDIVNQSLPLLVALACLAATFALAYISWRWVETPFRRRTSGDGNATDSLGRPQAGASASTWRRPLVGATACALVVCGAGAAIVGTKGASMRFPKSEYPWLYDGKPYLTYIMDPKGSGELKPRRLGSSDSDDGDFDFLVWGDSHAMAVGHALDSICTELGAHGAMMAASAVPPLLEVTQKSESADTMARWQDAFKTSVTAGNVRGVLLIARWNLYVDPNLPGLMVRTEPGSVTTEAAAKALAHGLRSTIRWLTNRGIKVAIMLEVPRQPSDPVARYTMKFSLGELPTTGVHIDEYRRHRAAVTAVMSELRDEDVTIIPVEGATFGADGLSPLGDSEGPYYEDHDHISPHGAKALLMPLLREHVQKLRTSG